MYKVYFAGDLFDHKHITGNELLARQIEKLSDGFYTCVLPQNWEGAFDNAVAIRNKDIKSVITSDIALFNFDGTDLDSGTVVEFMLAKMLDIPAVLFRSDIRKGGYLFNDDWNLMVKGYPRCVKVSHCALSLYNDIGLEQAHRSITQSIINAFQEVVKKEPILRSYEEVLSAYQHVIKMCGGGLELSMPEEHLHEIVLARKKIGEIY